MAVAAAILASEVRVASRFRRGIVTNLVESGPVLNPDRSVKKNPEKS
jgi:hypothetical protein